jgi:hypothetical protein
VGSVKTPGRPVLFNLKAFGGRQMMDVMFCSPMPSNLGLMACLERLREFFDFDFDFEIKIIFEIQSS